jgi:hypothetical protein
MGPTYAVTWREADGSECSGRLELGDHEVVLDGRNGELIGRRSVPYGDVRSFRLSRGTGERLSGRPTLLLELAGGEVLSIASVAQPGVVTELADRLASLELGARRSLRAVVVVPLKEEARARAEKLLQGGPPFDPAKLGLEQHEVFVTDREAIFVFEGVPSVVLQRLFADEAFPAAAEAWEPLVDGTMRYADRVYAWPA